MKAIRFHQTTEVPEVMLVLLAKLFDIYLKKFAQLY